MAHEEPAFSDDAVRIRLEGRAELLSATRLRYRALVNALGRFRWKTGVRENAALLQEVARVQEEVDSTLAIVARHRRAERWPDSSAVCRVADEVATLRARLLKLLSKRLARPLAPEALRAGFEALETNVVTAPRLVLPHQRWSTAHEVLPANVPELQQAAEFVRRLERLFSRPTPGAAKLPLSLEELDDFVTAWSHGVASLEAVWQRLTRIDATGAMVRFLRKRARRALTHPPGTGPELLLFSEFWRNLALSRMDHVLDERLSPIEWSEHERFQLLRWLWHRDHHVPNQLQLTSEPRAALFELAVSLAEVTRAVERAPLVMGGLIPVARLADRLQHSGDWRRLHDELQLLVRVLSASRRSRPPSTDDSLESLVRVLRDS